MAPHQILISMCTEERKKAKQSYKESLQNVATVRQQAAVSHFSSFMLPPGQGGGGWTLSASLDAPVGESKKSTKWLAYSPERLANLIKDMPGEPSSAPPHHETWPGFPQINVLTHNRHCSHSAAVLALAAFSYPYVFSCAWGGKMHYVGLELYSLSPPCSSNTFLSSWGGVCVCVRARERERENTLAVSCVFLPQCLARSHLFKIRCSSLA